MSKNAIENQPAKEPNSPEKFSKLAFLQYQGLLTKRFNFETMEFEDSLRLRFVFCFTLISKALFGFKPLISWFFPQRNSIQLYIGSIYNYLPPAPKLFMAIATVIAGIWVLGFHVVFARKDYRLFKFWMKLAHELPAKSDSDYRVAGLSREKNKQFWISENSFNLVWYRGMTWYILINSLIYGSQIFFVQLEGVEVLSGRYIFFQMFHLVQNYHAIFCSLHCFFTLNLFYVQCMRFFVKRFEFIGRNLGKLSATKMSKRIDNGKLSRLVIDYNRVHHDLILINDFWKSYVGLNFLGLFAMGIIVVFVVFLEIDWRLKGTFFSTILFLHLIIIYFPFAMAQSVTSQIHRTKRRFENIAFCPSVNLAIKQKIESISNLSDKAGLTCFDWFLLHPFTGLMISLEFVVILLLLIQTYFYYFNQF